MAFCTRRAAAIASFALATCPLAAVWAWRKICPFSMLSWP